MRPLALLAVVLLANVAGDGGRLGPPLDPKRLPQLPREGLAAEVGTKLVLASVRGRALGHLDDFSLARDPALDQLAPGPWPLLVRGGGGATWELRRGRLGRSDGALRLADGSLLRRIGGRWTLQGTRVDFVSERRDLVTFLARRSARVFEVWKRRSTSVAAGCRAAARIGARWVMLCGYPFGDPKVASTVQLRDPDGAAHKLFGPVEAGQRPVGWWTAAFVSPDRTRLLLQWSGECEIPVAFLATVDGRRLRTVTGQNGLRNAPESVALGWSGARALVDLPKGVCGTGTAKTGVYAVDPATMKRTYLFRQARFWRSVS